MSYDEQIAEAILGRDAQDFFRSELGKYIVGRARQDKEDALQELSRVSPWRRRRIVTLQNIVWRCDSIEGWLAELIINGRNAEKVIEYGTADATA